MNTQNIPFGETFRTILSEDNIIDDEGMLDIELLESSMRLRTGFFTARLQLSFVSVATHGVVVYGLEFHTPEFMFSCDLYYDMRDTSATIKNVGAA